MELEITGTTMKNNQSKVAISVGIIVLFIVVVYVGYVVINEIAAFRGVLYIFTATAVPSAFYSIVYGLSTNHDNEGRKRSAA